ncbi:unnamed protein product [Echinostoma caproni]|uniref:Uncharacterized protein n=1 Tax=Echinostoma caproni TaxID=27848 RepID=A0A3P8H3W1_9TREM|nr:unnamed protein product [Echinostoma caproni]
MLQKLYNYGVRDFAFEWIKAFLDQRIISVRVSDSVSGPIEATRGVPQGSVLGPRLLFAFVNDLPKVLGSKTLLFGDDAKIWNTVTEPEGSQTLQESLNAAYQWSKTTMSLSVYLMAHGLRSLFNMLNALKRRELDQRACELAKAEEDCRRAINMAVQRFNDALRLEQEQRRIRKAKQEQDDNMTEICNAIYSDMLTENPAQAISAFGPHRVVPDRFKGMSKEQLAEIYKEQQEQIRERERLRLEEKLRDVEFDQQRVKTAKLGLLLEREIERSAREIQKRLADENLKMAGDQKAFKEYLDHEPGVNMVLRNTAVSCTTLLDPRQQSLVCDAAPTIDQYLKDKPQQKYRKPQQLRLANKRLSGPAVRTRFESELGQELNAVRPGSVDEQWDQIR